MSKFLSKEFKIKRVIGALILSPLFIGSALMVAVFFTLLSVVIGKFFSIITFGIILKFIATIVALIVILIIFAVAIEWVKE